MHSGPETVYRVAPWSLAAEEPVSPMTSERAAIRYGHWVHFLLLVILLAVAEFSYRLAVGVSFSSSLASIPGALYAWMPVAAGVGLATLRAREGVIRSAVHIGLVATILMVAFDLLEPFGPTLETPVSALVESEFRPMNQVATPSQGSWISTGSEWLGGTLGDVSERAASYPPTHPRARAVDAINKAGMMLLVWAVLSLVWILGRWLRRHTRFETTYDEAAAHIVAAWLASPVLMVIVRAWAEDALFAAQFEDGALWSILVPHVVVSAGLTLFVLWLHRPHVDG
jgi:hypothetical protein